MIFTRSVEISSPLDDVMMYCNRNGDDLIVCSSSEYAIIRKDCTFKGPTRLPGIIGAIEGALVLTTRIKYLDKDFLPVKHLLGVAVANEDLIVVLLSGKVLLSKKGEPLEERDIFGGPFSSVKS